MVQMYALSTGKVKIVFSKALYLDESTWGRKVEIDEYLDEDAVEYFITCLRDKLSEAKDLKFTKIQEELKKKKKEAATLAKEIEELEKECSTK